MRVGVVGAGSIGRRHIGNLLDLGCVVTVCDVSEEARARVRAYPVAAVGDALAFEGLDALVIATPYDQHLSWVEEAIRRRLPFFVEKPLGSLQQLPRWREIAAMDLPVNQVGYMLRFHPDVKRLAAEVPRPELGMFRLWWDGLRYQNPALESSHEFDLAFFLCGDAPVEVSVRYDSPVYLREWTVLGGAKRASASFRSPSELGVEMYRDEMIHFLHCVRIGTQTLCPLVDGLRALEAYRVAA